MTLMSRIKELIKDNPRLLDMNVDSLVVLKELGITWENSGLTRGQLIHARRVAIDEYVKESYLIRVKFGFHEDTYDTVTLLAAEQKVSTAEIVRRALSLYNSLHKRLKTHDHVIVNRDHLSGETK